MVDDSNHKEDCYLRKRSLEMTARKDLVNRYLVTRSSQEAINRMIVDLKSLYPDKSLVEIRDMLKENDWVIRTPNPNEHPFYKEDYIWSVNYYGNLLRGVTEIERFNQRDLVRFDGDYETIVNVYCSYPNIVKIISEMKTEGRLEKLSDLHRSDYEEIRTAVKKELLIAHVMWGEDWLTVDGEPLEISMISKYVKDAIATYYNNNKRLSLQQ